MKPGQEQRGNPSYHTPSSPRAQPLKKERGSGSESGPPRGQPHQTTQDYHAQSAPTQKPPAALPLFFLLSHLEDDGPVRIDGVKVGVCEVMGLELDGPKLGAFAGALNALDFPLQLLVRQHPPGLSGMRAGLAEAQPENLPERTRKAAESLHGLLRTWSRGTE